MFLVKNYNLTVGNTFDEADFYEKNNMHPSLRDDYDDCRAFTYLL